MAGIFQRMSMIFRAKTDKALDKLEDPRETLDYSYQRQLELLQKVRRGVADVATSRKRVELQANSLNTQIDKLTQQAQRALEVGREDLAREALTRRSGLQQQLSDLQVQHAQLQAEEEKLTRASQRLQAKVDAFRTRKETIKATYSAAEAQTRINEAFSGISEEMGDVGLAIQRAEDKTAQMQARAGAIDELLASGALDDPSGLAKDDITRELEQLASTSDVEHELARMKAQVGPGQGAGAQAIEGGSYPGPQQWVGQQPGPPQFGQNPQFGQQPGQLPAAPPPSGQPQQFGQPQQVGQPPQFAQQQAPAQQAPAQQAPAQQAPAQQAPAQQAPAQQAPAQQAPVAQPAGEQAPSQAEQR